MANYSSSRRSALKRLASMTAIGAVGALRAGRIPAAQALGQEAETISGVGGSVIRKGDPSYETWRKAMVWHKSKPNRYPDVIVQARTVGDVIGAVNHARKNGLKVTTRSGGHNATGASLRDGGMLIDLSNLNTAEIDEERSIALVQPGVKSAQLTGIAAQAGFSFPVPHCPTVGMGGFLLGGGIGWNFSYRGGFSTLSIAAAEIVTADGQLVMASPQENPDLYWAVRGAGPGFFGVVTRFHLELYPTPAGIMSSSYILPLDAVEIMTTSLDQLNEIRDQRVEVLAVFMHDPDAPSDMPPEDAKICFVTAFAFGDSPDEARDMLKPFAESELAQASLAKVEYEESSYEGLYRFFGLDQVGGALGRYAVDSVMTNEPDKALVALAGHFRRTPSPGNHVLAGYGMNLSPRDDSCLSSIANHYVGCFIVWQDEQQDGANFGWLDDTLPLMDPYGRGHYINEIEARRHPERIRQCFSQANWDKLKRVRRDYDPDGVFHTYLGHT